MSHMILDQESLLPGVAFFIVVPWIVFVTNSIFNLKAQVELLKAQMNVLEKIQSYLSSLQPKQNPYKEEA